MSYTTDTQQSTAETVEEVVTENTQATIKNTQATTDERQQSFKSKILDSLVLCLVVAATVFISARSSTFAENQAGLILSGIGGGILGSTLPNRK